MFGHGSLPCWPGLPAPDPCGLPREGAWGGDVDVVGVLDLLVVVLEAVALVVLGAAAAPAMPAAAPPVASAPATIVAPSSLDTVI
jgi:hypothetical protein